MGVAFGGELCERVDGWRHLPHLRPHVIGRPPTLNLKPDILNEQIPELTSEHLADKMTGLAPWGFEFSFPGSRTSTFLALNPKPETRNKQMPELTSEHLADKMALAHPIPSAQHHVSTLSSR